MDFIGDYPDVVDRHKDQIFQSASETPKIREDTYEICFKYEVHKLAALLGMVMYKLEFAFYQNIEEKKSEGSKRDFLCGKISREN